MRAAPDSEGSGGCFTGIRLEPFEKLLEIGCRKISSCDNPIRGVGHMGNRLKIAQHVILDGINGARADMRCPITGDQRVTVGLGSYHTTDTDASTGTGNIFNDDGLAKKALHLFGEDAGQRICPTSSRRQRHHDRDRARWVAMRLQASNFQQYRQDRCNIGRSQLFAPRKSYTASYGHKMILQYHKRFWVDFTDNPVAQSDTTYALHRDSEKREFFNIYVETRGRFQSVWFDLVTRRDGPPRESLQTAASN